VNVQRNWEVLSNKKQWIKPLIYEKANAKNTETDIETNLLCFKHIRTKSLKAAKKAMDMVDVSSTATVLLFRFSIQSIGSI
jgi:hypothetical protein